MNAPSLILNAERRAAVERALAMRDTQISPDGALSRRGADLGRILWPSVEGEAPSFTMSTSRDVAGFISAIWTGVGALALTATGRRKRGLNLRA